MHSRGFFSDLRFSSTKGLKFWISFPQLGKGEGGLDYLDYLSSFGYIWNYAFYFGLIHV